MEHHIAVVGAGLAGLTCAGELERAGLRVTVFDKARGPGGRMASRRNEQSTFDHDAQYFTAHSAAFVEKVGQWQSEGVVAPWHTSPVTLSRGNVSAGRPTKPFVGAPRMSALTRFLSEQLGDVKCDTRIAELEPRRGQWALRDESGDSPGTFSHVVLAIPAPQAHSLVGPVSTMLARAIEPVEMDACWALMVTFEEPIDVAFDAAHVTDSPLGWIARNSSKPRRTDGERWVLHATSEWSQQNLDLATDEVAFMMLEAFRLALAQPLPSMKFPTAHRWRYARVARPLDDPALYDIDRRIGLCGDWCLEPRVEGAWTSGNAMAARLLAQLE